MTRNLRILGLALIAAFAMSAMVASVASATSFWFKSANSWTVLTGSQIGSDQFTTNSGTVACSTTSYTGSQSGTTATTVSLVPTYSGCEISGVSLTIHTNGCVYELHTHTKTSATQHTVTTTIVCPTTTSPSHKTHQIEMTVGKPTRKCTIDVPEQTIATGVTLTNAGTSPTDIKADISIATGITYSETAGTGAGACIQALDQTNGAYTGSATISGEDTASNLIGISLEGGPVTVSFESEIEDTTLIGETAGTEEFIVNAGTAKCTEAVYKGTKASKVSSEITLNPEYGGCTAFGFSSASIALNGCAYVVHSGETEEKGNFEGKLDVECPEGKAIEITAKVLGLTKCVVTIGAQTGRTTITSTNEGTGTTRDLKFDIGATVIKYTQDTGEGIGKCSSGTFENGKYNGVATVIGENSKKEQVGIWVK